MQSQVKDSKGINRKYKKAFKGIGNTFLHENGDDQNKQRCLAKEEADFYRTIKVDYADRKIRFDKIMIDITTRCNLRCAVCYRKINSHPDLKLSELRMMCNKFKRKIISICGGEPTIREDLPEIIRMFSRKNTVFLITNGIRLSNFGYLEKLKRNGLRHISFSLNSLSEENLSLINEKDMLSDKLKALDNLKRLKVKTILAVVLVKGINEGEVKRLFTFCISNRDFIYEFRMRAMAPLGRFLGDERFYITDMINLITTELGFNKAGLLRELELKRRINAIFRREIFTLKSCSVDFHIKVERNRCFPIGEGLDFEKIAPYPSFLKKMMVLIKAVRVFGVLMAFNGILKLILKKDFLPWIHPKNILKIGIRCWPDANTMDTEENKRCKTGYWLNGQIVSFCYANIIKDKDVGQI